MEKKDILLRIKELMDFFKLGKGQFADKIGMDKSNFSKLFKDDKPIGDGIITKIAYSLDINKDWLAVGKEPMLKSNISGARPDEPTFEKTIPYYPDVNASAGMDFLTENGHNYNVPIKIPNVDAQAFINVFGDSMYPKYCSGEIIGIKEIEKDMVFPGHAYVVQMTDGEAYIKYIDPGKDEEYWILRSENEKYKPKQFHLSKIRKVYIIKAVITKSTLL